MSGRETVSDRIYVGLSGWGDHDDLYVKGTKPADKLKVYTQHFPIIEMDNSFYAIPSPNQMNKWSMQTPDNFGFIVKAYQGMTGHSRGKIPFLDMRTMFNVFKESADVLAKQDKLKAVLFQYPPWFECERKNVEILKRTREWMDGFPVALEFRHRSWFLPEYREKTLQLMRDEGWIHSIADEPDAGVGSIPVILESTQSHATMIRLHGRNASGWHASRQSNWREVRYLYRYNAEELEEWRRNILLLLNSTEECWLIFNNNSGGDAADNAKQLMKLFGLESGPEPVRQLEWE